MTNIKNLVIAGTSGLVGFGLGATIVATIREFNELTIKVAEREAILSYDRIDDQMLKDAILDIRSISDSLKRFKLLPGCKDAIDHCNDVIAMMNDKLSCENY